MADLLSITCALTSETSTFKPFAITVFATIEAFVLTISASKPIVFSLRTASASLLSTKEAVVDFKASMED